MARPRIPDAEGLAAVRACASRLGPDRDLPAEPGAADQRDVPRQPAQRRSPDESEGPDVPDRLDESEGPGLRRQPDLPAQPDRRPHQADPPQPDQRDAPRRPDARPDRAAQRLAVRYTLQLLTDRAPGHSVEVRIPPFAAVQAIPGPVHRRGTPSAVIEMDPVTWLALSTGGLSWEQAKAAGRIRASGERADLSPWLPLITM